MYVPYRPSILKRPLRSTEPKANLENSEKEFEKEQQRLASKGAAQRETETRLIRSYYGTEEEKRSGWEAAQREMQQLALARQAAKSAEQAKEESWLSQPQQVFVDTQRPWAANSTTYYLSRQEEEEARRRLHREDAEQNRLMAFSKAYQQEQERKLEAEALKKTIQSEDAWFNRGAASERWIAPDHRVKPRAFTPPEFAFRPAPYHCDSTGGLLSGAADAERPSTSGAVPYGGGAFQRLPQPSARRTEFWQRESGQGAKLALTHNPEEERVRRQQQGPAQPVQQGQVWAEPPQQPVPYGAGSFQRLPQPSARRSAFWQRESGQDAKLALTHNS